MLIKICCGLICMACVTIPTIRSIVQKKDYELIQPICSLVLSMSMFLFWLSDTSGDSLEAMVTEMGFIKVGLCIFLFAISIMRIFQIISKR